MRTLPQTNEHNLSSSPLIHKFLNSGYYPTQPDGTKKPWRFDLIRKKCKKLVLLSSVDDPFIPINEPRLLAKGQLISEWIYAVIFPPKMPTKKKLPTLTKKSPKKCYDPCLYGRAEINSCNF